MTQAKYFEQLAKNSSKHNQFLLLLTFRSLSETFIGRRSWY